MGGLFYSRCLCINILDGIFFYFHNRCRGKHTCFRWNCPTKTWEQSVILANAPSDKSLYWLLYIVCFPNLDELDFVLFVVMLKRRFYSLLYSRWYKYKFTTILCVEGAYILCKLLCHTTVHEEDALTSLHKTQPTRNNPWGFVAVQKINLKANICSSHRINEKGYFCFIERVLCSDCVPGCMARLSIFFCFTTSQSHEFPDYNVEQ